MAHVLKDRVKTTSTTTGTGTYTLGSAVAGFQAFSVIGDGNTTFYCATDGSDWEVGVGTYTASGTTLARTTILASSNAGAAVNWGAGTRTIFCGFPAQYALALLDPNADRVVFWDDSAGAYAYLTMGNGLAITGTTLDVSVATQSDQETASSTTAMVTPGRQQYHPSAAKAWFKSTGTTSQTLQANYNITSLSDDGVGLVGVTIATDFSGAQYAIVAALQIRASNAPAVASVTGATSDIPTAGAFQLTLNNGSGTASDLSSTGTTAGVHCVAFGDQ